MDNFNFLYYLVIIIVYQIYSWNYLYRKNEFVNCVSFLYILKLFKIKNKYKIFLTKKYKLDKL